MSDINELFSLLSDTEHQQFIQYLKGRNKRHDTRNTAFVQEIIQSKEGKIRAEIGDNAYNVLKKRVQDRLIDFLANNALDNDASDEVAVIKLLLVARKLLQNQLYKQGYKLLLKAESQANRIFNYTLLNEIYHTFIEYSHQVEAIDQEELIAKLELNTKRFLEQERLNIVFAIIKKAFNAIEFNAETFDLEELLEDSYKRFGISQEGAHNFKTLSQLAQIADIYGAYKKNYASIDLYFEEQLNELEGGVGDTERYLQYHIDVLYHIANIYFRKKQFETSLDYLSRMEQQMLRYNKRYFDKYYVKYKNLQSLNLNYCGHTQQAIEILENIVNSSRYTVPETLNPQLALSMMYFQNKNFTQTKRLLAGFHRSDLWYERNMGLDWVLNKKYVEIIFHLELGNSELVESRIANLIRSHGKELKSQKDSHVLNFLKLIQKIHREPMIVNAPEFRKTVKETIEWKPEGQEDVFMISFYAWLKSKMEKKDLYETTLELVRFG